MKKINTDCKRQTKKKLRLNVSRCAKRNLVPSISNGCFLTSNYGPQFRNWSSLRSIGMICKIKMS